MIHYITTNGIGNAWVANELKQVRAAGVPVTLHSMRKPAQTFHASEWASGLQRSTHALYPLSALRIASAALVAPFRFGRRFWAGLGNALFGRREHLRARTASLAHFFVACHWARRLRGADVDHIHSQWIHSCGTIGMYGAWLLGVPFSFTGHAADLFRERCALRDKIRRAEFIVCISGFHREFYLKEGARPEQLMVVYCGIDTAQFAPSPGRRDPADSAIRIRSSGRLVEKKGFARLIDACRVLADRGVAFECRIAGSGPLEAPLNEQIKTLGLEQRVAITGEALKQEHIPDFMHGGDVYCLPCVWASDNDVDGLPQMLMEAMACGLPAISTRLVGIPDLIIHDETGLLVEPNDVAGLADAIVTLGRDRELAARLAEAGRRRVTEVFEIETCLQPLIDAFRRQLDRRSATALPEGYARAAVAGAES